METIKVNTSQHVDIDYPVAGLGERMAARLIDLAFFVILLLLVLGVAMVSGSKGNTFLIVLFIIIGALYVFYNLLCEIFMDGQSIGKRLMKIKVISIDGGQPTTGQFAIRWLFRLVDFVLTGQVGGMLCVVVSAKKQRIGDIVAGTTLIKLAPATRLEHIVFQPVEESYNPYFKNANVLGDQDIEIIHEVLTTYYKTGNIYLIHKAAIKVAEMLSFKLPEEEHRLDFLKTVIKDYNYLTSQG